MAAEMNKSGASGKRGARSAGVLARSKVRLVGSIAAGEDARTPTEAALLKARQNWMAILCLLFLVSDGAAAITGQVIYVDCGYQIMGM